MDRDQIIHDLVILELSKSTDNLTPNEVVAKYLELLPIYKEAYIATKPPSKVRVSKNPLKF